MSNLHPLFEKIVSTFAPEGKEWRPHVFNGVRCDVRQSDIPGPQAEDGGIYCERCQHFYVGENRCPRH